MAETAAPPEQPQTLDDLMIAMDVVDTLRHREDLVARELDEEGREAELIERLKTIYHEQGIDVPDKVLADGVRALKESRFVYTPPPAGWKRSLLTVWAKRATYGKRLGALALVLAGAAWAWYFMVARPARLAQEQVRVELTQTLPKALQQAHAEVLAIATDAAAKENADTLLADGQRLIRNGDRAGVARINAELVALRHKITGDVALAKALRQSHAEVLAVATDQAAKQKANALLADGERAIRSGNPSGVSKTNAGLLALRDDLTREFKLTIVSRPGEPSMVWRVPPRKLQSRAKNYYLIVEAVAPNGHKIALPIRSEETGETETVTKFGVRVPEAAFEAVRRDKADDGIVQKNVVGVRKRGSLAIDYQMPFEGGYITKW
jgi:hypothetical protein